MQTHPSTGLKRRQLSLFFLLSLAISWAIWLPQAAAAVGMSVPALGLDSPLMLLAVWGPACAAMLVTLLATGRAGLQSLFRPLRIWRVGVRWYLFALLFPAIIWLVGRGLDTLRSVTYDLRSPLDVFGLQAARMLPIVILFAFPSALGEELGWRGFALPRLQARSTAVIASIVLGLFWGLWHVPTLIAQRALEPSVLVVASTIVGPIPLALLYTWLFNNTHQSLLLVWLFHSSDAVTQYLLPRLPTPTDDLLIIGAAVLVVVLTWPTDLARRTSGTSRRQAQDADDQLSSTLGGSP
jgi:membrane protease YdiL (CAAX protease family)